MKQLLKFSSIILLIALLCLFVGMFFLFYNFPIGDSWDFRNNLWGPSYLLLHHQNPYQIKLLFADSNAVWLPPGIGLFSFLGVFSFDTSRVLWLLINLTSFFILCFLIIQPVNLLKEYFWVVLLALFPSTITNLIMGQFSIFSLFGMVFLAKLYGNNPSWINGLVFALLFTKPQLIIFTLPTYLFFIASRKSLRNMFREIGWILVGLLITMIPFFFSKSDWITQLYLNLKENNQWLQPNLNSLLIQQFGFSTPITLLLILIGLSLSIHYSTRHELYDSIVYSMALTPIFSPYIWTWDFVLFFPLLIKTYLDNDNKFVKFFILFGYLTITTIFIWMKVNGINSDEHFLWVSLSMILLLSLSKFFTKLASAT